jgi:outer membrane protein OmpA-like peptidoglycan-associated protein
MYIRAYTGFGDPPSPLATRLAKRAAPPPAPPYLVFSRIDGFAVNKFTLTPQLKQQVTRVADFVRARLTTPNPIGVVRLVGHTDSTGSDNVNVKLGKQRAETVRDELHRQLPDLVKLVFIYADETSPGKSDPTADNRTAAGRARNRRVDVYVGPPIPPAEPWPQGKKIDWTVRDPNPDKDPHRITRGLPPGPRTKDLRQILMDLCERRFSRDTCKTLVDKAISAGCQGVEALLGQLGARLTDAQKKEIQEQCSAAANRPL